MQTWQLSEEKGKLKVRAKTREVEATVLTVFLCFSSESMAVHSGALEEPHFA